MTTPVMTETPEEAIVSNNEEQGNCSLAHSIARLPLLVNQEDVGKMINLQVAAIDRLESTNKSLANCSNLAQNKLATTTRLFKRTAKQMSEAKKDLDVIYKKIVELKGKIRVERPDLFQHEEPSSTTHINQSSNNNQAQNIPSGQEETPDVIDQEETDKPER